MLISFLKEKFSSSPVIYVDIGANMGQFFDTVNNSLRIDKAYLFEPIPELVDSLNHKYTEFENVLIIPKAVSNETKQINFYKNKYSLSSSVLSTKKTASDFIDSKYVELDEVISVPAISLDDQFENEHISILKIDTQGYESIVLDGAQNLLNQNSIDIIIIEIILVDIYQNQSKFEDIHKLLSSYNYKLSDLYNKKKVDNILHWCDAIYIKE